MPTGIGPCDELISILTILQAFCFMISWQVVLAQTHESGDWGYPGGHNPIAAFVFPERGREALGSWDGCYGEGRSTRTPLRPAAAGDHGQGQSSKQEHTGHAGCDEGNPTGVSEGAPGVCQRSTGILLGDRCFG